MHRDLSFLILCNGVNQGTFLYKCVVCQNCEKTRPFVGWSRLGTTERKENNTKGAFVGWPGGLVVGLLVVFRPKQQNEKKRDISRVRLVYN